MGARWIVRSNGIGKIRRRYSIKRPEEYWEDIKALVKEKNILLIIDEVQTGVGRTGNMFGYELDLS